MKSLDNNDQHNRREELQDRLTEQQLREAFNAETPPDLSSPILAAADRPAESDPTAPTPTRVAAAPACARSSWRDLAVAACLLALIGGGVWAWIATQPAAIDHSAAQTSGRRDANELESLERPESFDAPATSTEISGNTFDETLDLAPEENLTEELDLSDEPQQMAERGTQIESPIDANRDDLQLSAAQIEVNEVKPRNDLSPWLKRTDSAALSGRAAQSRSAFSRRQEWRRSPVLREAENSEDGELFELSEDENDLLGQVIAKEGNLGIDAVQERAVVITEATKTDVQEALAKARELMETDPATAEADLRLQLDIVRDQPDVDPNKRAELERQIIAALNRQPAAPADELASVVEAQRIALQSIATAQRRIGTPSAEDQSLRQDVRVALDEIDKRYNEYLAALEQAHQANGEVQRNAVRQQQLIEALTKAKAVLDKNDLAIDTPTTGVVPKIDGFILRVAEVNNQLYIEISAGSDDGLRQGHEIDIYRGGTWLGRATIVRTTPDRGVGKVNRTTQRGEIRERDRAEARRSVMKGDAGPSLGESLRRGGEAETPAKIKTLKNGWRRSAKLPNTSRLMVGEKESLPLEGVQVNVQIDGFRARVLLDLYYFNSYDRQLQGEFQLRLPDEASLYFFAFGETAYAPQAWQRSNIRQAFFNLRGDNQLGTAPAEIMTARADSWRAPKEARIVPRVTAARAYQETVRRRVDPALVEWAGAGVFSANVFPLLPNRLHRIVIGYDVNLQPMDGDVVYRLDLPGQVGECTVDVSVAALAGQQAEIQPEVRPFTAAGRAYFHYDRPEYRQFEVRLKDAGNLLIHGADPDTGAYFAASFKPDLPSEASAAVSPQAVFLVDTSLSSNPEKFNTWLALLAAALNNNRDTIKEFAVLTFNIEQHWWQDKFVANTTENVDALTKYCYTLSLEGATDLGAALQVAAAPSWDATDKDKRLPRDYFLLSDGAITWGQRDLHAMLKATGLGGSLFAYRTGFAGTDVETLTQLARETGGAVFSVASDAEVEAASTAHRQRPWQLLEVSVEGGRDLILAGQPKSIFAGQRLLLVGRGEPAGDATIRLDVKRGDERRTIDVAVGQRVHSDLAPRQYGHVATMGLEELGGAAEDVSTAYARHFRITGRRCSLLMLESETDYQRFNIVPEDDAFVVKSTAASTVMANVLDKAAARLGDAKATFAAWIKTLESTPGLSYKISPAVQAAIDALPVSAFEVRVQPLSCGDRTWESIPEPLREKLSIRSFVYDEIIQEAQRRRAEIGAADALRALSSLVENSPGDLALARDVGFSALDLGLGDQAYHLLRRVLESRPYEPPTYLAIANCLADVHRADLAMIYYEIALGANWDDRRFPDFKPIASIDYLHFLRKVEAGLLRADAAEFAAARLESLQDEVNLKTCDLAVAILWNTDATDIDMHVTEPSGEVCTYKQRQTQSGGRLSRDVTQGFGPELYYVRNAPPGEYKIRAKYYSSDSNRLSTRTRVFATVYENWGTPEERVQRKTVTLESSSEMTDILTVKR